MPYIHGKAIPQKYIYMDGRGINMRSSGFTLFDKNSISNQEVRNAYPKADENNPLEIKYVQLFLTELQLLNYLRANNENDNKIKIEKLKRKLPKESYSKGIFDLMSHLRPIYNVDFADHLSENDIKELGLEWIKEKIKFTISHEDGGSWKSSDFHKMEVECEVMYAKIDIRMLKYIEGRLIDYNRIKFHSPNKITVTPELSYAESLGKKLGL